MFKLLKLIRSLCIPRGGTICGCGARGVVDGNNDIDGVSCDSKVMPKEVPLISFIGFSFIPDNNDPCNCCIV